MLTYAGERIDRSHFALAQRVYNFQGGSGTELPLACPAGQRGGYLILGEDDWGADESLHMCGFGDRSSQSAVCKKLPAKPAFGNPSGWY